MSGSQQCAVCGSVQSVVTCGAWECGSVQCVAVCGVWQCAMCGSVQCVVVCNKWLSAVRGNVAVCGKLQLTHYARHSASSWSEVVCGVR